MIVVGSVVEEPSRRMSERRPLVRSVGEDRSTVGWLPPPTPDRSEPADQGPEAGVKYAPAFYPLSRTAFVPFDAVRVMSSANMLMAVDAPYTVIPA